mmetsp:Transcript_17026/g.31505  ORF Transcript_17026/g.31505 Transcript_17026/m.31505 type:complete len:205 (+) Transcript_17026:499-1113(+)
MGLLRLLRRCGHAGADSPDWLVRNDHLLRVHQALDLLHLGNAYGHRCLHALLTLWEFLADGKDALHSSIEDVLQLGGKQCIVFLEVFTALRVTDQAPFDLQVFHLLYSHLACECSAALKVAVLRADHCATCELVGAVEEVERRRAHVNFAFASIALVDVLNQSIKLFHLVWIALPVCTNDWLARHGEQMTNCEAVWQAGVLFVT